MLPPDAPAAISNDDPMARPVAVAWTSARAKRCGFYFDPAKLRTSYLAYEARQASGEQYAKIEKTYDTTYKATSEKVSQDVDYCSDRKALEIKADLERHLAADYTPNLPKPKTVASCGVSWLRPGSGRELHQQEVLVRHGQAARCQRSLETGTRVTRV